MKQILFLLLMLGSFISNAQEISIGNNLTVELKKLDTLYYHNAPNFTSWIEGDNMFIIGENPNLPDCDYIFLALSDSTLIGAFKPSANIFMFDTNGDSIIDNTSTFFVLPTWVVKNKTKIISSDKTAIQLLDTLYEKMLQKNATQLDKGTMQMYNQYQRDTALANRHILLLFDNYQMIISETSYKGEPEPAEICIPLMKSLSGECLSLYNNIPAIVCIYMGEALQNAALVDEAKRHFEMSLNFYPNSIPLKVYNYHYEQDLIKKEKKLIDLKNNHPEHWMVKEL